jgi:glycosyltransferase involved in cell wall biosynthesis
MNKKTLHFVYSLPTSKGAYTYHRYYHKLVNKLSVEPLYRNNWRNSLAWDLLPLKAPYSISYNILLSLSDNFNIKLYNVTEKVTIKLNNDDIFLGHPMPDFSTKEYNSNAWRTFDKQQVTNQVIFNYPNDSRVFGIAPFNHSLEQLGWAIPIFEKLHHFIAICGNHWIDNLQDSPFAKCFNKISRLDMAIDTSQYPKVKKRFNPKGSRKFLYIGRISEEKNIQELENIAKKYPNFQGGCIGGEIKGWHKIADQANLTPHLMKILALEYDFFINLSKFDAQATTVMEAMSWGFIPVCTQESGYLLDDIYCFDKNNTSINLNKVQNLQYIDETFLLYTINDNYNLLLNKYSWNSFNSKIKNYLNHVI